MQIPVLSASEKMNGESPAYIIGRDGFYLRKSSRLYDCTSKVKEIPYYEKVNESLFLKAPRIPALLFEEIVKFFRNVYDIYQSESIVILTFKEEQWQFLVPEQKVSAAHLDYKMPQERNIAGTIHSHCDMAAFFSKTDEKDAIDFDGIHIVIGRINSYRPEILCGISVNGRTFELKPEDLIDMPSSKTNTSEIANTYMQKVSPCIAADERVKKAFTPELGEKGNFEKEITFEDEEEMFLSWNNKIY